MTHTARTHITTLALVAAVALSGAGSAVGSSKQPEAATVSQTAPSPAPRLVTDHATPSPQALRPHRVEPRITLHNATTEEEAAFQWALAQFEEAGLAIPDVQVHFPNPGERCEVPHGLYTYGPGVSRIDYCTRGDWGETVVQSVLLHELAHAWEVHTLTDERREAFMQLRGLDIWQSKDVAWEERATEHAAEIVMWGVFDRALPVPSLPVTDCESLLAGYRLLTTSDPPREASDLCFSF